jgi:hypothetical protein
MHVIWLSKGLVVRHTSSGRNARVVRHVYAPHGSVMDHGARHCLLTHSCHLSAHSLLSLPAHSLSIRIRTLSHTLMKKGRPMPAFDVCISGVNLQEPEGGETKHEGGKGS